MKKSIYLIGLLVFITCVSFTATSGLPNTEVWLFDYKYTEEAQYNFTCGFNLSNHEGYDSQPSFSSDGSLMLWTSEEKSGQTDIYQYDVRRKKTKRLSNTSVSEYSPTFINGGKFISAVVVEADSTQRLWKYDKHSMQSEVILPLLTGVGYHTWFDENTLFTFQLTEPFSLVRSDVQSRETKTVATKIGRCMNTCVIDGKTLLLFTQKDENGKMWIKSMEQSGNLSMTFNPIPCIEGSEDYGVDKRGNLLMASGTKLYCWQLNKSTEWRIVADLASYKLHNITRLAVSPDGEHIALVDNNQ